MLKLNIMCLVVILITEQYAVFANEDMKIGVSCRFYGHRGTCTLARHCPHLNKILRPGQSPSICAVVDDDVAVCCPPAPATRPTTTVAPTTTLSPRTPGYKAFEKCKEYSIFVNDTVHVYTGNQRFTVPVNKCGHKTKTLIVGGEDASEREFPHMALLGYDDGESILWGCGGTLISEEYILTAAHCISDRAGRLSRVRVGDLNIDTDTDVADPQEFDIEKSIVHPNYGKKYHDIALIRIKGTVQLNTFVIPACIRWNPDIKEQKAIASGWGKIAFDGGKKSHLQKVVLELFDLNECNASYVPYFTNRTLTQGILPDGQFCAGHHTENKDTCQGDSGGPLQVYQGDGVYCMYSVIGVTSFSAGCGDIGFPGVYTRVSHYIKWIEDIVWP